MTTDDINARIEDLKIELEQVQNELFPYSQISFGELSEGMIYRVGALEQRRDEIHNEIVNLENDLREHGYYDDDDCFF